MQTHLQRWIVVIGGFTQSRFSTGLADIWDELLIRHDAQHTRVTSHQWHEDWTELAQYMRRKLNASKLDAPVDIVAYSWGVGYGAMKLARALKGLGIKVRIVVSCDGIARPPLAHWRAIWSPLLTPILGEVTISVPANVKQVSYLRQNTNHPRGHRFVTENGTFLDDRGFLHKGWTHQDADDSIDFFNLAMELCG